MHIRFGEEKRSSASYSTAPAEQFAYLAVVLDAFSRKVIGWALELHLRASLAVDALKMAISARAPVPGSLIHHSDRGVQNACSSYSDISSMRAAGRPRHVSRASLKTFTIGNGCIQRSITSPRRNTNRLIEIAGKCRTSTQKPEIVPQFLCLIIRVHSTSDVN